MKAMELQMLAQSIARDFASKDKCMDTAIAIAAKSNRLNDEQIKRLVEDSNKLAFMAKFEKDGTQIFDVASFDEVKSKMTTKIEKTASIGIDKLEYSSESFCALLGDYKSMEKVASTAPVVKDTQLDNVVEALHKIASDYFGMITEFDRLEALGMARYNKRDEELVKVASLYRDKDFDQLSLLIKEAKEHSDIFDYIYNKNYDLLKQAGLDGIVWGAVKGTASLGASALGSASKLAQPVAGYVMKNPVKVGTTALMAPMAIAPIKKEMKAGSVSHYTGPSSKDVVKTAGFAEGMQNTIDLIGGAAKGVGGIFGGILGAAAQKLGGGVALTMNQREFDRSFDTIMKRNPELHDRKDQMREYFDVVSRHSPSIAKDPLVAENVVRNFDAFGGVDYNTVKSMHEMESKDRQAKSPFSL